MDASIDVMDADDTTPYVCPADSSESQGSKRSGSLETDGGLLMLLFNQHEEPDADFVREMERLSLLVADMEAIRSGVPPERLTTGAAPILDRWMLGNRVVPCLAGLSTGHPRLVGANRLIGTSDLWLLSKDHGWARTLSRWYRLGRPAERSGLNG